MGKKIVETVVETTKTKKELPAEVKAAKDAYAAARIQLDLAIKANQNSMHAFRSFGSEENKKAYEGTREAHKAALAIIKRVRAEYHHLCIQHNVDA